MPAPAASAGPELERPFRIEGRIPRRPVPVTYVAGLAAVAGAMILLPGVYVALIAAVGWGTYYYALHGTAVFQTQSGWAVLFGYLGPLFVGVVLLGFMIKPLFARRRRATDALELDLDAHPVLRDLIREVCAAVGAPVPVRVEVNCDVNAGARLRRGILSLGRQDLVLCIGLPLVNGLTTRQLAGVLAHEFGHFAQRAGMAFTYVIRAVNDWFARVVFTRDQWDAVLKARSEGGDIRIMVLFACARAGVALSRKILHGLMYVGHAVSCLQLRQMEFDADYYEAALVGSDGFASTAREINRLNHAWQGAFADLNGLWTKRQAVNDITTLILSHRTALAGEALAGEALARLDAELADRTTRWFHTHPSDAERIEATRRLASRGLFTGDGPASELFSDFASLREATTARFYVVRGLTVNPNAVVAATEVRGSTAHAERVEAAWQRLGSNVLSLVRPVRWTDTDFAPRALTPAALAADLADARATVAQTREAAVNAERSYRSTLEHITVLENARALLRCGVKINPRRFQLAKPDVAEAERDLADARVRLARRATELQPFEAAAHRYIACLGAAARTPEAAALWPSGTAAEVIRLTDALVAHGAAFSQFPIWVRLAESLHNFRAQDNAGRTVRAFNEAAHAERERTRQEVDAAVNALAGVANPFDRDGELPTTRQVLEKALHDVHGEGRLHVLLRTIAHVYFQALGRLAVHGEALEEKLPTASSPPRLPPPA